MNYQVTAYIPCFNGEEYLAAAIEGLLAQTHPPAEILVVDDGSTDSTAEIARQFPVRLLQHDTNKGLAAARNTAIKHASYELIASIDADVVPSPTWLERLLETFADAKVAGAGGRCFEQFRATPADRWRSLHLVQDLGEEAIVITPLVDQGLSGFAAVFRKSALEDVGGYNELYRTNWEDWDICVRLREAGYTLIYHTPAVAFHMKRDTAYTVIRTAWRWVFWMRLNEGSYENPWRKLLQNVHRTSMKVRKHIEARDFPLLGIDFLYLTCFCYWDLRYFLSRRRERSAAPSAPQTAGKQQDHP